MKSAYIILLILCSSVLLHSCQALQGLQVIRSQGSVIYSPPPSTPSYMISKSGSTYYAMDEDGNIDSSSSNARTVIQYAIDHTDGLIFIEDGSYPISTSIVPDDKTHIKGESWNTILIRVGSSSIFRWNPSPSDYLDDCIFENFQIDGKKSGISAGAKVWIHGFFFWNVRDLVIKNLYVHHMPACGIEIKGFGGLTTQNVKVLNCKFEDCGGAMSMYHPHSVYFNGPTRGILIENCESYRSGGGGMGGSGFQLRDNVHDAEFRNCISDGAPESSGWNLIDGIRNVRFFNCSASNNNRHGWDIWNEGDDPIYDVLFSECKASGNGASAVRFKGISNAPIERIEISHNEFRNQGTAKDIRLNQHCDYFKIVYNHATLEYPTGTNYHYEVHDNYG